MRVEIARVSPSRQILSTWGTKAAIEQQPAIMPTIVGSQLCMTFPRGGVVGEFRDRKCEMGSEVGDARTILYVGALSTEVAGSLKSGTRPWRGSTRVRTR